MNKTSSKPEQIAVAKIEKLSHEGRGITYIDGKVTFVDGALPGEEVRFKYTKRKSQLDEGLLLDIIKPSPDRVQPKCAVFGICGGCSLQHMSSEAQILFKQEVLKEQFLHFGKVEPKEWLSPLQAEVWAYRNKARLGVKGIAKKGGALVGFREKNDARFITDMQRCEILHPSLGEKIQLLRDWIASLEASKTIPQLEVAVDDSKTALIIRHLEALSEDDQLKIKNFAQAHHYWIYLQPKGPDSIKLFYPEGDEKQLAYALPQYKIEIKFNPEDFTQVNGSLNPKMIELALFLLDIQPEDKVLDLFCGLGNFTLPIARFAKSVIGVEGDESMTQRAALNATNNGISNVAFYAANLFEINENAAFMQQFDKILLDPPRAGAEEIVKNIKNFNAKRIVYVSCNPSTLARDAGILVHEAGYTLEKAGVMDMFPHTTHVESIALFTK